MNDLRFAIRQALNPGLTIVAVLTNFFSVLDVPAAIDRTRR
jgi:hypothetical protein